MKVLVTVKRVIDPYVKVRVKSDGSGVETANVKMAMNPFCEIAVEQAVRMKEAGVVTEIVAVSIGVPQCQETLRTAMAMGADRGILVETAVEVQPLAVAKVLKAIVAKEQPEARHHGQAGDRRRFQPVGPDAGGAARLAAGGVHLRRSRSTATPPTCTREIDGGLEKLTIKLPAVVTTDLRLNEPRYVTLPNIMKAKKKPLEVVKPDALGVDVTPRLKTLKVRGAAQARRRREGRRREGTGREAEERSEGDLEAGRVIED